MVTTANKRKKAVAATIAAAAILLAGTFAWTSISQQAKNEAIVDINPGGRLHDDFNGTNKDVYVENFNSKEDINAVPIYARIRLDEYMEIGQEAGKKDIADDKRLADSVAGDGDINNTSTWQTYIPGENTVKNNDAFRKYWTWDLGNSSVTGRYYMPTFDKNKDSLDADINGTYQGTTKDDDIHYDDYREYGSTSTETADEFYDWDSDTIHEDDGINKYDNGGIKPYDETMPIDFADVLRKENILHKAEPITKTAQVITMAQWLDPEGDYQGAPGDYWVYDTDGWAYWANPIMPGETTGMLLDGIRMHKIPDDSWYYGINVVAQFTTAGDFAAFRTDPKGITDNGLKVLAEAAKMENTIQISGSDTVKGGYPETYTAEYLIAGTAAKKQPDITWRLAAAKKPDGTDIADGLITMKDGELSVPGDIEAIPIGSKITIEASTTDGMVKATKTVTVGQIVWNMRT